jgi:signal transduction histidine kinase/ligand-binding sensor domain-containing protein
MQQHLRHTTGTLALLSVAYGSGTALGGQPLDLSSQYDERTFTVRDGLPQATVNAITQSRDGYLWLGTDGGLARFDGHRFKVWTSRDTDTLRIPLVRSLNLDQDGDELWITTVGGTGVIRYSDGKFHAFEAEMGLTGNGFLSQLQASNGTHWFSTWWGVIEYSNGRFTRHQEHDGITIGSVQALAEDRDGSIWFASLSGLLRWHNEKMIRVGRADGLTDLTITVLLSESTGALWAGTRGDGLYVRPSVGAPWQHVAVSEGSGLGNVNALLRDHEGTLWVGTDQGLARVIDGVVERVVGGEISTETILSLFEDREWNLWVGTRSTGLTRLRRGIFRNIPAEIFQGRLVLSVIGTLDGSIWFGTDGLGLIRYYQGTVTRYRQSTGLCTDWVWSLGADAKGQIWVGGDYSSTGICRLDPATGKIVSIGPAQGLPVRAVRAITATPDGDVWVGTVDGLFRIRNDRAESVGVDTFTREIQRVQGYPAHSSMFAVYAVHKDRRGDLWVAAQPGVHRYRNGKWTAFGRTEGISNGQVFSIHEDEKGALWLGTLNGFSRIEGEKVTAWKDGSGFRNGSVFGAVTDKLGDLWVCSSDGIYLVTRFSLEAHDADPTQPLTYARFGREDGIRADMCAGNYGQSSFWRSPGGVVWFLTAKSAVYTDPAVRQAQPALPDPHPIVEEVMYDDMAVSPAASLGLPPGRGDLRIGYTSIALGRPEQLRFRYRLDPFDNKWVDASSRREAYYTHVPPGRYRFMVNGTSAGTPWALKNLEQFTLVIEPHFFQRRIVQAASLFLLALLLLVGGIGVHRRRLRTIEARHASVLAERLRISRDLHDTLGQGFTGISVQLEAVSRRLGPDSARARENLDMARALTRASLADARRAVWDLRAESVEQGDLVMALSTMARGLSASVPVRVQVNGAPRIIPAAHTATLLRIGQESMTNAVRHSGAKTIVLEISFLPDSVQLRIVDDGKGFNADGAAPEGQHMGMQNLRDRAAEIGAALQVKSRPGHGTEISVVAPLPRA